MKRFFLFLLLIIISGVYTFAQNSSKNYAQKSNFNNKNEHIIGIEHLLNLGYPVHPAFEYSYSQSIYLQAEVGSADVISKIWFEFGGTTLEHSNNWTIYIGHTAKSEFDDNTDWVDVSSLMEVYSGSFPNPTETGWIEFDIADFSYNGIDNLIIAVDQNEPGEDMIVDNRFYTSGVTDNRSMLEYSDSENIDPASPPTNALLNRAIPNLKFFQGTYPDIDASLIEIIAPEGFKWVSNAGVEDITVLVINKGEANLTDATFNWTVNGVAQIGYNWSGNLATNESENITIGNYNFANVDDYKIMVETDVTNDGNSANDTLTILYETVNPFVTNYSEDFETFLYHNTPDYWAVETHSVAWIVDDRISHSGDNSLRTFCNEDEVTAKDDWAFMPLMNLVGGEEYQISFWVNAAGWNDVPESLELKVGTNANSESMTQNLWSSPNQLIEEWQEFTVKYTPEANGNYVFAFHSNSVENLNDIAIDDITIIGTTAGITDLADFEIEVYPNPSNGEIYIHTSEVYNLNVFDVSGKRIFQTTVDNTAKLKIEHSGLYFLRFSNAKRNVDTKIIIN